MSLTKRPKLNLESLDDRIVPAVLDLTTVGAGATVNGAIVHRIDGAWNTANGGAGSHGVGALNPFLTMNKTGGERGYNTDNRPVQFSEVSDPAATHSIQLNALPQVTVGGVQYREFVLNLNEPTGGRKLSVDELQIFLSGVGNLGNYNTTNKTLGKNAAKVSAVYDMDLGGDNTIVLKSMTNQGVRAGEMALLIPESVFTNNGATDSTFVYLYTRMGVTFRAQGGAEEWGFRSPPNTVSSPATLSGQVFLNDTSMNWTGTSGTFTVTLSSGAGDTTVDVQADGSFTFTNVTAGFYSLSFTEAFGYTALESIPGHGDGYSDGDVASANEIVNIDLAAGENGVGYGFIVGSSGN